LANSTVPVSGAVTISNPVLPITISTSSLPVSGTVQISGGILTADTDQTRLIYGEANPRTFPGHALDGPAVVMSIIPSVGSTVRYTLHVHTEANCQGAILFSADVSGPLSNLRLLVPGSLCSSTDPTGPIIYWTGYRPY
jgi:hypothetical protein